MILFWLGMFAGVFTLAVVLLAIDAYGRHRDKQNQQTIADHRQRWPL